MERISRFSTKKFICSVIFNIVVLVSALLVFRPFFEENDDSQIAMIVEGVFGAKEWHVIYPNFILGKLYVLLQSVAPMVRWHVILQYVFIFVAYVFATYVISKHKRGTILAVVAVLASFYEMYVSIQYTKTAAFVCASAFILFFEYVRNSATLNDASNTLINYSGKKTTKENKLFIIIGFVLVVYGAMLRPESVFIAAVPAVAVGIIELLRTKKLVKYVLVFIPAFILVFVLEFVNSYVYKSDEDWTKFMNYNQARMQLNDYRYDILDFSKYGEELESLNVSENDALAILTYQYGDDDVFSYERFLEIRDPFPAREFGYTTFANLFENLVGEVGKSYCLFAGLVGLIAILIASIVTDRSKSSPGFIKDSRRKLFIMLLFGVLCGAAIVYFQYSGRFSHRLLAAIIIPTMFLICYMVDSIYIKDNDSKIVFGGNKSDVTIHVSLVIIIVLMGLNGLLYKGNSMDFAKWSMESQPILRELSEISKDKNSLYVADTFTFQNVFRFEVFDTFEEGALENYVTSGSWYINSPITKAVTEKYGYENPFEALRSGAENVYLLDNQGVECKTLFLTEHYDKLYEAEKLENRGGIDVYHVSAIE